MASKVLQTNYDVDYVISYRIPKDGLHSPSLYFCKRNANSITDKEGGISQFKKLIRSLAETGLTTEVRRGDETSLLVFVKAADEKILADVVHRSRIKDWLHGVRQIQPSSDSAQTLIAEPLTDAERYRQIHHMICCPREEGGAAITPKHGEWKSVEAIFPLHDHVKNKRWLSEFSRKTFLTPEDLDEIKNTVGEKVCHSAPMFPFSLGMTD